MSGFISQKYSSLNPDNRTGINLSHGVFEAIVMENKDALMMGRLAVYIPDLGGNVADPQSWKTVRYASPFYGITPYRDQELNATPAQTVATAQASGSISPSEFRQVEGSMLAGAVDNLVNNGQRPGQGARQPGGSQGPITSYGMWAVPPDLGVTVLVMFAGGDLNRGFWFACVPTVSHGMVPAIGAPDGKTPMAEFNPIDPQVPVTEDLASIKREPHQPLVQQLSTQGLQADPMRGPITSSSFREAPSNVFGISSKAGHNFVMDDGDQGGKSKLIRLRTAGGNQITMNDDTGFVYIINASGTGWIEIGASGQIDVYGEAGINLATKGDINLHADKNVKIHAGECLQLVGMKATKIMGGEEMQVHGKKTMIEGVDSLHVHSCKEMMITSFGDIHMKAFNYFCLKGKCFFWNSCTAKEAEQVPPEEPKDVSGYKTTVVRAPSHEPYKEHDGGGGAAGGGATGPAENDPNVFAGGGGGGGGGAGGGGATRGTGSYGVPGGVGAVYGNIQNTGGYDVVSMGQVTAGVSAMRNADYIRNITLHWTGNDTDTVSGVISTMQSRNMGYNEIFIPASKSPTGKPQFLVQDNSANLRTNGQLNSTNGTNNTNTYHISMLGGEGTMNRLTEADKAALRARGVDLGNTFGKDVTISTHGENNPGHREANEGAVMRDPLKQGLDQSKVTQSDVKSGKVAKSTTPGTSVQETTAKPATQTATVKPTTGSNTQYYNGGGSGNAFDFNNNYTKTSSGAFVRTNPTPINLNNGKPITTVTRSGLSETKTSTTATYNPATSVKSGGYSGIPETTSVKPSTITINQTKTTTTQAGPMGTPVTTTSTSTRTIDTSSPEANTYLGRGGAQVPAGQVDPATGTVVGASDKGQDPLNNDDGTRKGATPAQEASNALDQTGGAAPASDIPAAPGGGQTGCFATGDNCARPADGTGGGGAPGPGATDGRGLPGEPMSPEEEAKMVEQMKADAAAKGITLSDQDVANLKGVYAGEGYGGVITAMNRAQLSGQSVSQAIATGGYVGWRGPNYNTMTTGFAQEYKDWSSGQYAGATYILSPNYYGGTPYSGGQLRSGFSIVRNSNQVRDGNVIIKGPWP